MTKKGVGRKKGGGGWPRRLRNPPPAVVVPGVALSLFLLGVVGNYLGSNRSAESYSYPRVVYVDREGKTQVRRVKDLPAALTRRPVFDGEVFRTSDRLAEACALAGNAVVYASTRGGVVNGRGELSYPVLPPDHRALLRGMAESGAVPPGMEINGDMTVSTAGSVISVRYQPNPLSVEVVSVARDPKSGPALLLRLPDEVEHDPLAVRYYQAQSLSDAQIPEAFSPAPAVIKLGWLPQILKGEGVSAEQYAQANRWLAEQTAKIREAAGGGR